MRRWDEDGGWKEFDTYLLLHLAHLELVGAQLGVILRLVVSLVLLRDDLLDLAHQGATGGTDSFAGRFQAILGLAHERGLDTAGSNELGSAGSDVVGRNNQLLGRVTARDDTVGSFDQRVGRGSDCLGRRNQPLRPAIVLLVKSSLGRTAPTLAHNFLLRHRGGPDELGNGIGHGDGRCQDRVVNAQLVRRVSIPRLVLQLGQALGGSVDRIGCLGQLRVDQVSQITLGADLAALRRERLHQLR